ncbi:TIGR04219 family outer membrane beta-barrel protein [Microbulbifer elongatus]|uniref:TIGR04219 family outer membrane beta-barrel protein n=1 Tax=Microbulbifer elongatus TaxID=86173 RepID=A0ABT1NZV8_9GAMM|nr:TIGR04219 family outer membrane beta-barrel protein [Microbulbifer elongatus]MCQ3829405.1 TIGR04219 family outer membrane beta-barrel protein [Microbulbifer elongatus]
MKKITLAICAALASASASADTILGFDATLGAWKPAYSGTIGVDNFNVDEFALAEDNVTFIQAALEHPIPLIPNILVAHSKIETNGATTLDENVTFGDETFVAGSELSANMTLSHTDATLYYEILDNWVNLDLGLTARMYDGDFQGDGVIGLACIPESAPCPSVQQTETIELSGVLPMVYGVARFDLPFTGWSIIAQGNGTSYNGDRHTDLTAKIRWDFVPALDFAIEAGYRSMTLDVKELDALQSDLEIKGPYLGLNLHL